jgi:hypothetical protein
MSLSGTRLKAAMKTDILAQLMSKYPGTGLLAAEVTALVVAQTNVAEAVAYGSGPDIVSEITGNAATSTPGAQSGGSTLSGTVS